jgi:hypothetical protein
MASTLNLRDQDDLNYQIIAGDKEFTLTLKNGADGLGSVILSRHLARGLLEHLRTVLEQLNTNFDTHYVALGKFDSATMTGNVRLVPPPVRGSL